ncbi:MAG: hypothetical protein B7Y83_12090 [Flavobacteriales bacterium 32-34-25]|nr:MAG: hypothetical protein B7Y83_12090 [Flavobacteriales bacterium 32-34-25]
MKKHIYIVTFFLIQVTIYSQDFIKSDSLKIDNKLYQMRHLSYGNSSGLKLFKVVTCDLSNLKKIEAEIKNCWNNRKLEYTEFYILSIPNYRNIQSKEETNILIKFLEKIDLERMNSKLSTALVKYKLLNDFTCEYFLDEPKESLSSFKDYKLNVQETEICSFLIK